MLLNRPITLKDMESVDVELYNSILYVKDNDPEPLCLNFAVNKQVFGEVRYVMVEPKPKYFTHGTNKHALTLINSLWNGSTIVFGGITCATSEPNFRKKNINFY